MNPAPPVTRAVLAWDIFTSLRNFTRYNKPRQWLNTTASTISPKISFSIIEIVRMPLYRGLMEAKLTPYLSREDIAVAVAHLAAELDQDYRHCAPVLVGTLKGGFIFLA